MSSVRLNIYEYQVIMLIYELWLLVVSKVLKNQFPEVRTGRSVWYTQCNGSRGTALVLNWACSVVTDF